MDQRKLRIIVGALGIGLLQFPATQLHAENLEDKVVIKGFMTSAYSITDQAYPFNGDVDEGGIDDKGSWKGSRIGLNFNANVTDKVNMATQFTSTRDEDNFVTHLDWGFVSYDVTDAITVRAGKVKYSAGLVAEYVDVGVAYPWINPPQLFYGEESSGPQATRESYTGMSLLSETTKGDWVFSADLFAGEVPLATMNIRELTGLTARADWDDIVLLQATHYSGTMNLENAAMNGQKHSSSMIGIKIDWNNIIAYSEVAKISMGSFKPGESDTMYVTLGYQFDDWLPHVTYQQFTKGKNAAASLTIPEPYQKQHMTTLGVKINLDRSTDLKIEYSAIKTDRGVGLFVPPDGANLNKSATMLGVALDVAF